MNLLFITSTYPTPLRPRQGAFNRTLVEQLRKRHHVHVIAPIPWTQTRLSQTLRRMADQDVDYPISFYPPKILRHHYGSCLWQSIRPAIRRLSKQFRPDAVVGYWLHPDGEAALRAARYFNVPGIVMSGGSDLRRLPVSRTRRRAVTGVLQTADRVIVVSEDLRRCAISLGANAERVELVRRGVNRELFYPVARKPARAAIGLPNDAIVLLWAGRLEPVKNPAMLLYAAHEWHRRWGSRLRVLMYGDGSMRNEIQALRDQLQLQDVVDLQPAISQIELALRYKASDLTVLTSHSEGIPNILLESIACGVPFVATDVGGVSEIATPGLDALVGDGNIQQLVEAVIQQVQLHSLGHRLPLRRFQPADVGTMTDQFEAAIQQLLPGEQRQTKDPHQGVLVIPSCDPTTTASWTEAVG